MSSKDCKEPGKTFKASKKAARAAAQDEMRRHTENAQSRDDRRKTRYTARG